MSEIDSKNGLIWRCRDTEKIIADLREEVAGQKECITRYAFQAVAFTAAIWGLVLKASSDANSAPLYLCGVMTVSLLLMVVRMANHKYSTVNRNLGYELHLMRLKDYVRIENGISNGAHTQWANRMLEVGWEEAMCAWRIVQPTIFDFLYTPVSSFLPQRVGREKIHRKAEYLWFSTGKLIAEGATYHPGHYLRNIHNMLHFLAGASLVFMWWLFWNGLNLGPFLQSFDLASLASPTVAIFLLLLGITGFAISQYIRQSAGRKIRERELLSIQSNAVVWRVVVTCHILAVEWMTLRNKSYQGYTNALSRLAIDFNKKFYEVHPWLESWEKAFASGDWHAKLIEIVEISAAEDSSSWGRCQRARAELKSMSADTVDLVYTLKALVFGKLQNAVGHVLCFFMIPLQKVLKKLLAERIPKLDERLKAYIRKPTVPAAISSNGQSAAERDNLRP